MRLRQKGHGNAVIDNKSS